MGVLTLIRGSKNYTDLNHIKGLVTNHRIIKHKHEGKYRTYFEDVLVLNIQGSSDEFGFMVFDKDYKTILNLAQQNNPPVAEIYYDQSGQRIEQNVTLHIFDLKLNDTEIISIKDIKKSEWKGSIILFSISILFLIFALFGARRIRKWGRII